MSYLTNVTHVYYNLLCISPLKNVRKRGEKSSKKDGSEICEINERKNPRNRKVSEKINENGYPQS